MFLFMYVLIGIYLVKGKKFEHISNSELSSYTSSSKAAKLIMLLPLILRIICPLPIPMFAQKHTGPGWLLVRRKKVMMMPHYGKTTILNKCYCAPFRA